MCGCSWAVGLCLLVSLLGIVVFVVFSKIYMFLGGDSHCPTHASLFLYLLYSSLVMDGFSSVVMGFLCLFVDISVSVLTVGFSIDVTKGSRIATLL